MWFLFQAGIMLAVVQSQVTWHWADAGIQVGIVGAAVAWFATQLVSWGLQTFQGGE